MWGLKEIFLVGFFLASLAGVLYLGDVRLKLEGFLLAGCALALFFPLLTFLSGVVEVTLAAALALLFVSGLLLLFLVLMTGWRQLWWRAGVLLLIFLGLFSLGMLTPWRGLLLTGGGLVLVGTFMLLYARRPHVPEPEPTLPPVEAVPEPTPASPLAETTAAPVGLYCPYCASPLADEYSFCPGCGHNTDHFCRCADCGHQQYVPAEAENAYCIGCGQSLDTSGS